MLHKDYFSSCFDLFCRHRYWTEHKLSTILIYKLCIMSPWILQNRLNWDGEVKLRWSCSWKIFPIFGLFSIFKGNTCNITKWCIQIFQGCIHTSSFSTRIREYWKLPLLSMSGPAIREPSKTSQNLTRFPPGRQWSPLDTPDKPKAWTARPLSTSCLWVKSKTSVLSFL